MEHDDKGRETQLAGFQRKYLRGLAHSYKPLVQVGQSGITESVVKAVDSALIDHELIKVRLQRPEDKKSAAQEIADKTGSELLGLVGHTLILYRRNQDEPKIELPSRRDISRSKSGKA